MAEAYSDSHNGRSVFQLRIIRPLWKITICLNNPLQIRTLPWSLNSAQPYPPSGQDVLNGCHGETLVDQMAVFHVSRYSSGPGSRAEWLPMAPLTVSSRLHSLFS